MRSIIKPTIASAISLFTLVSTHQQPLNQRLDELQVSYDIITTIYDETVLPAGKPYSEALIEQVAVVQGKTADIIEELGCRDEKLFEITLQCSSLIWKELALEWRIQSALLRKGRWKEAQAGKKGKWWGTVKDMGKNMLGLSN